MLIDTTRSFRPALWASRKTPSYTVRLLRTARNANLASRLTVIVYRSSDTAGYMCGIRDAKDDRSMVMSVQQYITSTFQA